MIATAYSSVLILIILAASVLVLVPYEISAGPPTNVATIAAATPLVFKIDNKVAVDRFGITEIYPTKPNGGREWYINKSSPLNDNSFSLSGGTEKTNSSLANATSSNGQIIKQPDGSYQVYGVRKTGKYDFSVRMNVNTLDNAEWWKNVEMTGYAKVISATSSDAALDWYARGRLHISESPCEGIAYHAGLRADGSVFWQKEIWHTGGYTNFRSNITATHPLLGRWVGFKAIMFNINNDSAVRLQIYLDDNATNHWKKVADVIDNGGWYADTPNDLYYSANCGRSKDYIILNAGPIATFRSDNMIWDFKDLSIREIQAPSDVKSNTLKQLTTNTSSTYNPYIFGNATQEWLDKEHSIKILFTPSPEYPPVGNTTQLGFSVQDLKTGINLKNETATLTVINNFTANIGNGANKGSANADFNIFKNISAPNGSFSVKYHFLQTGTHQIIVSIKSKNNVFAALASFNVLVSSNAGSSNSNGLHNRAFSTFSTYFAHPPYSTSSSNIGRVVNSNSKAIMLGFDDGWKSQITYAKPILDKYGLKASFFVVCNYVNSGNIRRMNWQDIARLQKDGMDIESHSMNHPLYLNKLIQKQLDYEIGGSKQCLTSHGYNSTIFAYPYNSGSNDPAVVNTVAKYYNIGRSGTAPLMFLNCIGFKKHPQTDCRTYGSNTVLNYANRYAARSLSFDIVEIKDSFNNTKIFSDFVKVVNSQSTYNHGGKINAVPLIIFHNITFTINRPYNTNAGLFDQLMKYLYEDHFKVLTYKQLGYNTQDNTFYLNGIS